MVTTTTFGRTISCRRLFSAKTRSQTGSKSAGAHGALSARAHVACKSVLAATPRARSLFHFMSTSASANEQAVIKTSHGEMTLAFWPDVAPKTVENFKKLARDGFYDGTAFHRIIKGFMIQGGCPNTKEGANGMPGTGDPGYKVKAEFNAKPHVRGVISMARSSHPDSAGCQFFICHGDARFLDRQYTAFGELVKGDDVLEKIANIPTKSSGGGEKSTPIERVTVESVKIVPAAA
jgi:peptidyl-prolyl cis-trans isomerase B (cyclophilin B)